MYHKELEEIIDAALADGVLTDKEREVLHKKAAVYGVDPDELDVVVEGRLSKMKRETDWLRPTPPRKEELGDVMKCPACGAIVPYGSTKCLECGTEFRNIKGSSAVRDLLEKLTKLDESRSEEDKKDEAKAQLIRLFPIPNSKEEIIELMLACLNNIDDPANSNAWISKAKELEVKAIIMLKDDQQAMYVLEELKKCVEKERKSDKRMTIGAIILLFGSMIAMGIIAAAFS